MVRTGTSDSAMTKPQRALTTGHRQALAGVPGQTVTRSLQWPERLQHRWNELRHGGMGMHGE